MNIRFLVLLLFILPVWSHASIEIELDEVDIDVSDSMSLYSGAKYYATYCQGCHSAKHMRYARLSQDLDIPEDQVIWELAAGEGTINDSMLAAMKATDAEKWFWIAPPDLSVIARSRSPDWLYSYLKGFYLDQSRPFGVNNRVYKDVAMPNVLADLQGHQKAVLKKGDNSNAIDRLDLTTAGSMSPVEFDKAVTDLVNFLVYVGEPVQLERQRLGKYVIFFLIIFLVAAYLLKKEYWKDVH